MKDIKGTKTEQNLREAFAGESQARNKYTYYASKARKDGFEQIAAIFEETANNEKEHAKLWFKMLHGNDIPGTLDNLRAAGAIYNVAGVCVFTNYFDAPRSVTLPAGIYLINIDNKILKVII